mmetsp:Transcript_11470/g.15797  ORF Transcript_11470/g.15797 Transcript_11470/m.15797 type:complete len:632 (+) Transcript_11470:95-1990(+)
MDNSSGIELLANILPPTQKGNNFINISNNGSSCHFLFVNAPMKIGVILNTGVATNEGGNIKVEVDRSEYLSEQQQIDKPASSIFPLSISPTSEGKEFIRIDVFCFYEDNYLAANSASNGKDLDITDARQDLFEIISNSPLDNTLHNTEISLKFKELSLLHSNSRFILAFVATKCLAHNEKDAMTSERGIVRLCHTTVVPIITVRHKLHIIEDNNAPYVWYKDEGGKDKCIELKVCLTDEHNNFVCCRTVPLRVMLAYESGQVVQQQHIMFLSPDSKICVMGSSQNEYDTTLNERSIGSVKIRINEVSIRHQGQFFQVLVMPDTVNDPNLFDIAPAASIPIEVKSKRNSIAQKKQSVNAGSEQVPAFPSKRPKPMMEMEPQALAAQVLLDTSQLQLDDTQVTAAINSFKNILTWTGNVMKAFEFMQWVPIGQERDQDGALVEPVRTLYQMTNPNKIIEDIMNQYTGTIMGSLTYMNQHLNSQSQGVKQQMQQQILLQQQHSFYNSNDINNISNNEFLRAVNSKSAPRAVMPLNLLSSTASSSSSLSANNTAQLNMYQPNKPPRMFDNTLKSIPLVALNAQDFNNKSSLQSNSAGYSAGYNAGALQYSFAGDSNNNNNNNNNNTNNHNSSRKS